MSTLGRYRALIPAHAAVADELVLLELELAVADHTASAWGTRFDDGMVWAAAHSVELSPAVQGGAQVTGHLTSQRDGDLSRTYGSLARNDGDDWWRLTFYGQRYLETRSKLAAAGPRWVSA